MLLQLASAALLLAILAYRTGRVVYHHILTAPDLPSAYYAGGNWSTHCTPIRDPDLDFCEDMAFWDHHDASGALTDRHVLVGCDPNRQAWNTVMGPLRDPDPRGHLFLYVPSTSTLSRVALTGYPPAHDFHPLGMEIYPSRAGSPSTLLVVNHARAETTIEQFSMDPEKPTEAVHVRTLRSPLFVSPNAIAMTSPTSFFVSNDHLMTRRLPNPIGHVLPLVETVAGLPLGWVAHVAMRESQSGEVELGHAFAALGVPFANGVAVSPDRTRFAVASTSLGLIYVYALNASTDALAYSHSVPVPFFPDNIAYDDDGVLIVAGHPHFPALIDIAANKTEARAPSWAVSITPRSPSNGTDETYDRRAPASASKFAPAVSTDEVETLFQSDGSVYASSSTALRDARTGTTYISGLYGRGILACRAL